MGSPGLAIDGNRSPKTPSSFCTKTYEEDDPYWYVDLGYSVTVDHVTIVNRRDSLMEHITPFDLHVGDSTDVTRNPRCGGHHRFCPTDTEHVVHCRGMKGRYVGIKLPGKSRILSLCEVEVYAATNLAWGKPTVQSKVAYKGVASRATDGCRDPDWDSLCCTSTPAQSNPWLRVDLGTEVSVRWVVIINRQDKTGQRLDLFELYVGNEERVDRNRHCGSVIFLPYDKKNKIATNCNGIRGRYVGIRLPGNSRTLSICEVEVYEGTVTRKRTSEVRGTEGQDCGEHQAGDTWLSDDGEKNCICEMNQTVCYEVICGESGEDKPFLGKDGLWTCPEPAAEEEESGTVTGKRTSEVRGTEGQDCGEHQAGDTWLSDDGEENCICEMNQTVCYEVICGESGEDKPFLGKDGLWTCPEPAAEEEESD
ncbi:uncharacterized protein LOC118429571 isoform X1 [Branchiostoma floridae]|uniref:Uncharacterized protein LOC118429571 isoform X1 n=1 Tax=Branchiostoma floridae TaxID=7739 RepID=A0A9J7M709_BRAFL|nr:uncharacterized protein LOC118429571 isoform X1 [Branchiostoma floridae]